MAAAFASKDHLICMRFLRKMWRFLVALQLLPALESGEETLVGGQAVLEGVMMRSPHAWAIAVRKPSGEVATHSEPLERPSEKHKWMGWPVVRGVMTLVYEYHGAEHKTVFAFESGDPLNTGTVQKYSTYHPRCGTSFLMTVMIFSIFVYIVANAIFPVTTFWARFATRIVLLPVIAGLSYEIIRFAARHRGSLFALMTAPGLWLQRITTQPPADDQVQCAIVALDQAMSLEKQHGGELVIA